MALMGPLHSSHGKPWFPELRGRVHDLHPRPLWRFIPQLMLNTKGKAKCSNDVLENKRMDKTPHPFIPEKCIVAGCGAISIDYLASVANFPQPDEKIRTLESKIQGGGNAGNALTAAARLGLRPRLISKVADDAFGKLIVEELKADGVDTSFMVVSDRGTTSFTYVIVDRETNTRTCINSPGYPVLDPRELPNGALDFFLQDASVLYLDGRLQLTAMLVAKEAKQQGIPILLDAERKREGLDDLLELADYIVCSAKFPQAWTEAVTLAEALVEMASRRPNLKFVIATLGASGCVMLERSPTDSMHADMLDANITLKKLMEDKGSPKTSEPFVLTSQFGTFKSTNGMCVMGRFLHGTAETIAPLEVVDTTGSGDAFIGAVLYSLCAGIPSERMLRLGATVAGANCRALGARAGLPHWHDPKLCNLLKLPATQAL